MYCFGGIIDTALLEDLGETLGATFRAVLGQPWMHTLDRKNLKKQEMFLGF